MIATTEEFEKNLKVINKDLDFCRKYLEKYKIKYEISTYTCWEEVMLSFKYLLEFCNDIINYNDESINLYLNHRTEFLKGSNNYMKLFEKDISDGKTIETSISDLLRKISKTDTFKTFRVTKDKIGYCWYIDCDIEKDKIGVFCKDCYALKKSGITNPRKGRNRLIFLYNNSLFKVVFKNIYLRLRNGEL